MAKKNKTCLCCETAYRYCSTCDEFRRAPAWMNSFDNENCMKVFNTCSQFSIGLITKDEAKAALAECDLSGDFREDVKGVLAKIMEEPEKKAAKVFPKNAE